VRGPGLGTARAVPLALPAAAGLALVAAAVGPLLPAVGSRPPLDLRELVPAPPPEPREDVSPLDQVPAWLQNPDTPLVTVRAVSAVPQLTRGQLEAGTPAAGPEAAAALALPGPPSVTERVELERFALEAVSGAGTPFQQAVQLAGYLRDNEVYDVTAPPGHS